VRVILPGNTSRQWHQGAWRLAARVPRQAVWKRGSPDGLGVAPSNIAATKIVSA